MKYISSPAEHQSTSKQKHEKMRQKRAKSYKKQLLVYHHVFKFREPYQVLVDNEIVLDCERSSFDLARGLKRTLQAEVKPMITQCCIQALYETKNQQAIEMAKQFERRRCNHPPGDSELPANCIMSVVNVDGCNKHRYVVASQDLALRRRLREVPGVPLVHIARSVMIMEHLSTASANVSQEIEKAKLHRGLNDTRSHSHIELGKVKDSLVSAELVKSKKRSLGPKAPNPLSVKKKKTESKSKETEYANAGREEVMAVAKNKKRRRKHKKNGRDPLSNENE